MSLEHFARGYVDTALYVETEDAYSANDFSALDRTRMRADCAAFLRTNGLDLAAAQAIGLGVDRLGGLFWLARNGLASFAKEIDGELGARLDEAASAFGPAEVYVGEDGPAYAG